MNNIFTSPLLFRDLLYRGFNAIGIIYDKQIGFPQELRDLTFEYIEIEEWSCGSSLA